MYVSSQKVMCLSYWWFSVTIDYSVNLFFFSPLSTFEIRNVQTKKNLLFVHVSGHIFYTRRTNKSKAFFRKCINCLDVLLKINKQNLLSLMKFIRISKQKKMFENNPAKEIKNKFLHISIINTNANSHKKSLYFSWQ